MFIALDLVLGKTSMISYFFLLSYDKLSLWKRLSFSNIIIEEHF